MKNFCPLILALVISYSCSVREDAGLDEETTTIEVADRFSDDFPFDRVVDKSFGIPLQTTEQSLISAITKIKVFDGKLYVFDRKMDELFLFYEDGTFVGKLNREGEGPEEYREMRDFDLDQEGNIYILDFNRIIVYSNDLKYIREIKYNFLKKEGGQYINPIQFFLLGKDIYLWAGSMGIFSNDEGKHKSLYRLDENAHIKDAWFPVKKKLFGDIAFNEIPGGYLFAPDYSSYDIFSIKGDGLHKKYKVDFQDLAVPLERLETSFTDSRGYFKILNETDYVLDVSTPIESPEFLYFNFFQKDRIRMALYSKETGNLITGSVWLNDWAPPYLISYHDGFFYGYIDAGDYLSLKTMMSNHGIDSVKLDDNPIVIRTSFKEF